MPTFTVKLDDLLESGFDVWIRDVNKYPIFDEAYRDGLNAKIVDHYRNYEIGQETQGLFRHALNRKMREIMPLFNQLYVSARLEFDPWQTVDVGTVGATTGTSADGTDSTMTEDTSDTSTNASTSTNAAKSRTVSSETPQVQLAGNEDYASSAADAISSSDVATNGEGTGTGEKTMVGHTGGTGETSGSVTNRVKGSQGHTAVLLAQYRQTFLNLDMDIISSLENLFMAVWDNGDEFNQAGRFYYGFAYGGYWGV